MLRRGDIACSISTYTTSDNGLCKLGSGATRLVVYALCITTWTPQSHRFYLAVKIFQYICPTIYHVSTNSGSADNASHEYKFKSLDTFLTLKCDNSHYCIVLFFMSYSSLFIQLGRFQPTTHCLNSRDNSVQLIS